MNGTDYMVSTKVAYYLEKSLSSNDFSQVVTFTSLAVGKPTT